MAVINSRLFTLFSSSTRARSTYNGDDYFNSERIRRAQDGVVVQNSVDQRTVTKSGSDVAASIWGFRVEKIPNKHGVFEKYGKTDLNEDDGVVTIIADSKVQLRVFGDNLSPSMVIAFTSKNDSCTADITKDFPVADDGIFNNTALFGIEIGILGSDTHETKYVCLGKKAKSGITWHHQGTSPWLKLYVQPKPSRFLLPAWLQILCIIILLCLSGLFSGLNLGLMTLDPTELKIVFNCGTEKERRYAKAIMPLRKKGNFLLCTVLLGNVLVNTTVTILLDDMTSGWVAVIGSTLGIVVFGEIIPQAICSRHGMAVGAHTIWLTKFFMILTFPLSFPISKLLDCILGAEIGHVYNRERLMELIKVTHGLNDLEPEEVNIISGALELKKKNVTQIMTPLNDVYMVPYDAILNYDTVSEMLRQGFTRIPVFEEKRTNVVALLNLKDLALIDPDDNTPVKTLCKFYNHHVKTVFDDTTLDVMLDEFKKGRSHMAFVQRVSTEDNRDPVYETVGVVTLEDVIEEIIQSEIEDETDLTAENRRRLRRRDVAMMQPTADVPAFAGSGPQYQSLITPQLQLATIQFLSTTLDPFREEVIAPNILRRLLRHAEAARFIKLKQDETTPPCLYMAGHPADYFVLILEGRIEVKVGTEHLLFQSGPFTYFGISVLHVPNENTGLLQSPLSADKPLHSETFVPDFTVYPATDLLYLQISRAQYIAAYRASTIERVKLQDSFRGEDMDKNLLQHKRQSIATNPDSTPLPARVSDLKRSLLANSNVSLNEIHMTPNDVANIAEKSKRKDSTLSDSVVINETSSYANGPSVNFAKL